MMNIHKTSLNKAVPCSGVAQNFLDDFTDKLIKMIENAEHGLQVSDIRAFLDTYKASHTDAQNPLIRTQYQHCLTRYEQEVFDPATRREPFKRMISNRIADLFPSTPEAEKNDGKISRRILPGLFFALEKMVGHDFFTLGDRVCTELATELKRKDQFFVWEDLYTSEQAQDTVDDLLMALVPHFSNPIKRVTWMVGIINADLANPNEYHFEGPPYKNWSLDDAGMIHILRHLFARLKHQLTAPPLAKKISVKYGVPNARALVTLIKTLDHADM